MACSGSRARTYRAPWRAANRDPSPPRARVVMETRKVVVQNVLTVPELVLVKQFLDPAAGETLLADPQECHILK